VLNITKGLYSKSFTKTLLMQSLKQCFGLTGERREALNYFSAASIVENNEKNLQRRKDFGRKSLLCMKKTT